MQLLKVTILRYIYLHGKITKLLSKTPYSMCVCVCVA